ncbi:[NiFe] hydrogenase metallocenter assembly protein HypD [Dissulfuribacter thermophilus]|uniref:[NiFe] hydrogenase metallocenter assembly protein HypD n=1 Tax=Dissulfuribacter thermophilus TaxID=1156395 RepID=A0A1B9F916_9BACT|nr:hydrogenase formation protein HypD [Dissulfuribacter thermophilus]OCC16325.1 [NiFe] hydrogenase metallocenter assembly protein HypD [Dissulfuribacter thermophilus]
MKWQNTFDPFRSRETVKGLHKVLLREVERPVRIMEVCGTHTMSIFQHGLRELFPEKLKMISGPGCPVCVTSQGDIDTMIGLSREPNCRLVSFGDMLRVPGSNGSLRDAMAQGAKVHIVYSPMDALEIAKKFSDDEVVFLGIGFETTAPSIAATIIRAKKEKIKNFSVLSTMKLMPPALHSLFSQEDVEVDGLLCPGHVSAIIGARAYVPISEEFKIPCVIAGFEPADILAALILLIRQIKNGESKVENAYERAVSWDGNERALEIVKKVFYPVDVTWRGIGVIPQSGLSIRKEFEEFCARKKLGLKIKELPEPKGCRCGEVLKGAITPPMCPLFKKACTPATPVGPCMVSSEGICHAYYRYGFADNDSGG